MANDRDRVGRMFGEEKGVQSNKPEPPDAVRRNRSPNESNAARSRASLLEKDTGTAVRKDIARVRKGLNAVTESNSRGIAKTAQLDAAGRATTRLASRAGYVGTAFSGGYAIGEYLKEKFPEAGKKVDKVVDKVIGDYIKEQTAKGIEKVELTAGAKKALTKLAEDKIKGKDKDERVNKEDYPAYKKDTKSAKVFREKYQEAKEEGKKDFDYEGRKYNTMSKGGTPKKYNKGGAVKANCGASMKPQQKAKK